MEAYYKDLSNVAEFAQIFRRSPDHPPGAIFYLGKGKSYGIEFFLQKKTGWLTGWLGYTLGKVEYKIPEINPFKTRGTFQMSTMFVQKYIVITSSG